MFITVERRIDEYQKKIPNNGCLFLKNKLVCEPRVENKSTGWQSVSLHDFSLCISQWPNFIGAGSFSSSFERRPASPWSMRRLSQIYNFAVMWILKNLPLIPVGYFISHAKQKKTFQDFYCVFNTLRKYPNYFHASCVFAWKVQKKDLKPDVCFIDATDWWFDSRPGPGLPSLWDASVFFGEAGGPVFPSFHSEEPLPWTDPTGLGPL